MAEGDLGEKTNFGGNDRYVSLRRSFQIAQETAATERVIQNKSTHVDGAENHKKSLKIWRVNKRACCSQFILSFLRSQ